MTRERCPGPRGRGRGRPGPRGQPGGTARVPEPLSPAAGLRGWKPAAEGPGAGRQGLADRGETPGPPWRGWCVGESTSSPPRRTRPRLPASKWCCRKRGCPTLGRSEEGGHLIVTVEDWKRKAQKQMVTPCSALICLGPASERREGEKPPSRPSSGSRCAGATAPTGAPPGVSEGTPTGSSK